MNSYEFSWVGESLDDIANSIVEMRNMRPDRSCKFQFGYRGIEKIC